MGQEPGGCEMKTELTRNVRTRKIICGELVVVFSKLRNEDKLRRKRSFWLFSGYPPRIVTTFLLFLEELIDSRVL